MKQCILIQVSIFHLRKGSPAPRFLYNVSQGIVHNLNPVVQCAMVVTYIASLVESTNSAIEIAIKASWIIGVEETHYCMPTVGKLDRCQLQQCN